MFLSSVSCSRKLLKPEGYGNLDLEPSSKKHSLSLRLASKVGRVGSEHSLKSVGSDFLQVDSVRTELD
jgi:hypothetical protein